MAFGSSDKPEVLVLVLGLMPTAAALVVPVVVGFVRRTARKFPKERVPGRTVEYPRSMRFIMKAGWLFILMLSFPVGLMFASEREGWRAIAVMATFLALIVPLHMEASLMRITWDAHFIYTQSAWRKYRTIPFSAVRSCDYYAPMRWYCIRTEGYGTVRLHQFARGVDDLLKALPCPTPPYPPEA